MPEMHNQSETNLADRYGARPAVRWFRHPKFLIAVLAVAFLALITFIGINVATPDVQGAEVKWRATSDNELLVDIDVKMAAGAIAQCAVQALDYGQTQVGYALVKVGPSTKDEITMQVAVKTQRKAVVGQVASCRLISQ